LARAFPLEAVFHIRMDFCPPLRYTSNKDYASKTNMIRVSSSEFGREFGHYQDVVMSEPVIVTSDDDGHDCMVVISVEEYKRLKRRDRRAYGVGELPDEIFEAIKDAKMDPRHAHLDALIEDWTP